MDHSAEASMEEILASIRRIIAAEPKAVKAFADEHFQKFSDTLEQFPSLSSAKAETSFGENFSDKKISQDLTQKMETSFSSLSSQPLSSRKISSSLDSKPSAQRFVQALDDDLAGLIESPLPSRHETKKDELVTDAASEKLSDDLSHSNYSETPSNDFIPSQNIQYNGKNAQVENLASSIAEGSSKKEPSFYSNLTSKDFLKKEDFLSSPHTASSVFALKPKDLLEPPTNTSTSLVEDVLPQPLSAKVEALSEIGGGGVISEHAKKQEKTAFFNLSAESNSLKEEISQKDETNVSPQIQRIEANKEVLPTLSDLASQRSFEDVVTDMLRPMLEKWIEKNLPHLVPKLLKIDNS